MKDRLIGSTAFREIYVRCKHCGKTTPITIEYESHIEGEIKYIDGREMHLGPDGETWHYKDGGMVGYGGYSGI